jgi:hypothetical protein
VRRKAKTDENSSVFLSRKTGRKLYVPRAGVSDESAVPASLTVRSTSGLLPDGRRPDDHEHGGAGGGWKGLAALHREPDAALGATGADDGAATAGAHAFEETVGAGTADR